MIFELTNVSMEKNLYLFGTFYLNALNKTWFNCIQINLFQKKTRILYRISIYHYMYQYKYNGKFFFYSFCYKNFLNIKKKYNEKNRYLFTVLNAHIYFLKKRRKRRKFHNEDERRIARILKNRRTAEESRQRKIQKMKHLEHFVFLSEEKEKSIKKELFFLGKLLISRILCLCFL